MTWKLVQQLTQSIISSIQNTGVASVQAMAKTITQHTYPVTVTNQVTDVKVKGEVKVSNQQDIEKQMKLLIKEVSSLKKALAPRQNIKVDNFPKFPAFPAFPKKLEVSNLPTETKVSNFKEVVNALSVIETQLKELKLDPKIDVKAPIVNVPAPIVNVPKQPTPQVNVEKPDLSGIKKLLDFFNDIGVKKPLAVRLSDGKAFYKALDRLGEIYSANNEPPFAGLDGRSRRASVNPNGEIKMTVSDTWGLNDDEVDGSTRYLGKESLEGRYMIIRMITTAGGKQLRYASVRNNVGVYTYSEAWSDKENLTYGFISEAF